MIVKLDLLINQIQSDYSKRIQSKIDEPFSINISVNEDFLHSQLLIDCLLHMKTTSTDKHEFINLCKTEYSSNNTELPIIQEFQQKYISNQSIWWYTKESFINRVLNKALCIKNLDLLYLLGFFIRDIHENLQKNKCKTAVQVYHGQLMSMNELHTFKNSIGECISINTFLLAYYNRKQVISCLNEYSQANDLVRILFEIDADPQIDKSRLFADITSFACVSQGQQILFMFGSVFQIIDIQQDKKNGLWIVKMSFSTFKKDYDETNLMTCGQILQQMKKYDQAEKHFIRLVRELPPNHQDISQCYNTLGLLTFFQNNFNSSIQWYERLLKTVQSNDPNLANIYYSIGCVYQKILNYTQALEYYTKALEIYTNNESVQMAECLNNMGCIYEIGEYYAKALEYHQKALSIRDKYQIDLGSSYNNIGNIYLRLGEYNSALENYNFALKTKSKSLSVGDPSLPQTLRNIALVYEQDQNFEEALQFYQRAALIFEKIYPSDDTHNIQIQEDIQRVSSA